MGSGEENSGYSSGEFTNKPRLMVVGIGASAGGLEALQQLVPNLPKAENIVFIVAQHLSPNHKSLMLELLSKDSTLPVEIARDGMPLEGDHLYLCPQNFNIEITQDFCIRLSAAPSHQLHFPKPSVDQLLESIALNAKEMGVGIILSGTGSDGARGLVAIKEMGGVTIVQDPQTAKFDGMPNTALNTVNSDYVLVPYDIGPELARQLSYPKGPMEMLGDGAISAKVYRAILKSILDQCKVDFTSYKETTIIRRILRRMIALKIDKPERYLEILHSKPAEVELLFQDLMLGITAFFRDVTPFEVLKAHLSEYIVQKQDKLLRMWVPGCATGEEAYTLAILLSEMLGEEIDQYKIQIFATDIDKTALDKARHGQYPESAVVNLPARYIDKYFIIRENAYEVKKSLKSMLLFSQHDVLADPPFLRLDLISCRNLLIYFNSEAQKKLLPIFHYSLQPNGLLFLGKSESVGSHQEMYKLLDRNAKLYRALYNGRVGAPPRLPHQKPIRTGDTARQIKVEEKGSKTPLPQRRTGLVDLITQSIADVLLPYVIVLNENMDIVYVHGKNPFLVHPEGEPTNNIYKNILPEISPELRIAIHQANVGDGLYKAPYQRLEMESRSLYLRFIIRKLFENQQQGEMYVVFIQTEDEMQIPSSQDLDESLAEANIALQAEQERQIANIKTQLQTVIEELETSNEEMQALNEELQSSNEELQSSNEELETTNEELQSTNEELQTAYSEMRLAYDEKETQRRALEATKIELTKSYKLLREAELLGHTGSWLFDCRNREMSWSAGLFAVFGQNEETFSPSYEAFVGITHKDDRVVIEHLFDQLMKGLPPPEQVIYRGVDVNKEIIWLKLRATLNYDAAQRPAEVVGNIANITESVLRRRGEDSKSSLIRSVAQLSLNGVFVYNYSDRAIIYSNEIFESMTGWSQNQLHEAQGENYLQLYHPDDIERIVGHLEAMRSRQDGEIVTIRYRMKQATGGYVSLISNDVVFDRGNDGEVQSFLGNIQLDPNSR